MSLKLEFVELLVLRARALGLRAFALFEVFR
jgi:hypothetical protein